MPAKKRSTASDLSKDDAPDLSTPHWVKKFAKATHHSWGLLCAGGALARDDGEAGAGAVIVRMLERAGLRDHVVVVTRWYGGKPLGGDRFRHVQEAVRVYLASEGA